MQILESQWLIQMLEKSSHQPIERLVNIFDILADWLNAPGMRSTLTQTPISPFPPASLLTFLANEAIKIKAEDPKALAYQICFMAITAIRNDLTSAEPVSLQQAKIAAYAMIKAQTPKPASGVWNRKQYGIAASILIGTIVLSGLAYQQYLSPQPPLKNIALSHTQPANTATQQALSPMQVAVLFANIETMRKGSCQFPEALQIPDQHKAAYIDIVVNGKAPNNLQELAIANRYLSMVRCNYTPMLMANSKS